MRSLGEIERLRAEYRRRYGREHPRSCEEADPSGPCVCGCGGALHGVARKTGATTTSSSSTSSSTSRVTLDRWLRWG